MDLQTLKFPIGICYLNKNPSRQVINKWILDIEEFPLKIESLLNGIDDEKLDWKYRPNGWSIQQVVHHCADSHMNSIIRFKLTLTEDLPTIRPYAEDKWSELSDYQSDAVPNSIILLKSLHKKWSILLRSLTEEQLSLEFIHPEGNERITLTENIAIYSWHCNHHYAHIKNAIASNGKYN